MKPCFGFGSDTIDQFSLVELLIASLGFRKLEELLVGEQRLGTHITARRVRCELLHAPDLTSFDERFATVPSRPLNYLP